MSGAVLIEIIKLGYHIIRRVVEMIIPACSTRKSHVDSRRQDLDLGVFCLDGVVERLEAIRFIRLQSAVEVIFVADFDVSYFPWIRMPQFRAECPQSSGVW